VPVDGSVTTPPVVTDDEAQRDTHSNGSDLQDSDSSATPDNTSPVSTFGATNTVHGGPDLTGPGASDLTGAGTDTEVATDTGTLVVDLPLDSHDLTPSGDPTPSLTSIDLDSGQLLDVDLSTDGPVAPPLPGVLLGGLDQVRRDLEQANDSGPVTFAATLQADPPQPSWSVPDDLTLDPTSAERTAAFQKAQAKRIEAFNEAQAARAEAFTEQMESADPISALLNSAAFVVSELFNTAAVVVTEFVNYISFAITEFIHGISDWFTTPATFSGMYGNPTTNQRYWQSQRAQNCVLQATAMIINQLYQTPDGQPDPDEEAIALAATQTQSVVDPTRKMYNGLVELDADGQPVLDENGDPKPSQQHIEVKDAIALLDSKYGITATLTEYDKTEGNLALRALAFALEDQSNAVMVGVQGYTIWNAVDGHPLPGIDSADHQVVVIGIDFDNKFVYLNDSGEPDKGKNLKAPLDAFMRAWQTDNYETVVATLKQPASGVTSTNVSAPTVLVNVS